MFERISVEMSTFPGTCEIEEFKEGSGFESKMDEQAGRNRMLKPGKRYSIEDDINELFKTIDVNASVRGLGRDALRKNSMKKPMRFGSSQASGIGITESVSLKQALRGLCISQASEMAAMKRLSKQAGSSGASEAGPIKRLYRAVVVEASESGVPLSEGKGNLVEISFVPDRNISSSSEKVLTSQQMSKAMVFEPCTIPAADTTPVAKLLNEMVSFPIEARTEKPKSSLAKSGELKATHSSSNMHTYGEVPKLDVIVPSVELPNATAVPDKGQTSVLEKDKEQGDKFQSSCTPSSSNAGRKTNNSPCLLKPVFRNKNFLKKKVKQDLSSATSNVNPQKGEVNNDIGPSTSKSVCQTHNYTIKTETMRNDKASPASSSLNLSIEVSSNVGDTGASKPSNHLNCSNRTVFTKANERSSSREKGEFSQSSKSSIGDYSSSTSISEESSLSGYNRCDHRPHMSKVLRWEAVRHVQTQCGSLSLKHFKLLKRLGCGDIGTVYLAELTGTNCLFALKVMDNEFLASNKKIMRAQTEREILQMLDHPFLPTLYAHFASDKLSCLVMEYCPGGDLHVLRQKQPNKNFSEQAARFYVAEVLLALEYLHMLGVVYRDLKPENILVREDGHIMLTDFDLSLRCAVNPTLLKSSSSEVAQHTKKVSSSCTESNCIGPFCLQPSWQVPCFTPATTTKTGKLKSNPATQVRHLPQLVAEPTNARSNSFVGTHEYLAPEIIKGEGHGSAVDWWTFGIFLYELLYGKTPFKGLGNEDTLVNVVSQGLKFPECPIVSFHARDLIRGLLVKEPENRLGCVKGATEIKQHSFFAGLNWALIRCATPPQLCGGGTLEIASQKKNDIKCREFELF